MIYNYTSSIQCCAAVLEFCTIFLLQNEQIQASDSQPLIRASAGLQSILTGVCELLEVQELARKVENESDLNSILQENVLDTCHWVGHTADIA